MGDLPCLIDISPEHQHVAISHAPRDGADNLMLPAVSIRLDDAGGLRWTVDTQIRWQAFDITGDPVTVGGKYRHELYPAGVLPQAFVHCLEPPFRRQAGKPRQFQGYHPVGSDRQIVIDLPVDKSEQHDDENRKHARHHEGPVEGVRADELRLTHRSFAARMSLLDANSARRRSHLKLRYRAKNEPGAADIVDHRGFVGPVHFMTQPAHMHVHEVGRRHEFVVPDLLQQHGTGQQLVAALHHVFKEPKLAWQQFDHPIAALGGAFDQIQLQRSYPQDGLARFNRPAQQRFYPGDKLHDSEWLGQIIVTAHPQSAYAIVYGAERAQYQHGGAYLLLSQRLDDRETIHSR